MLGVPRGRLQGCWWEREGGKEWGVAHLSRAAYMTVSRTVSTPNRASSCSTKENVRSVSNSDVPFNRIFWKMLVNAAA
jgi:hypothetical protein